jgi:hypothetical protein
MRAMTLAARSLLDFPIALFEVFDDGAGDLVLLILIERSAHSTDQAQPPPEPHQYAQSQLIGVAPHL